MTPSLSVFGANHDGDQVAGTFTVSSANRTVETLLTSVEQLFGGAVTASIDTEGRVVLADDQAGSSSLSLSLTANNEGGGDLSFGTVTATTQGTDARSAELQAAQDAFLRINGIALSRSSNTVTDAVQGVTLELLAADEGTLVEIAIDKDDTTELRANIQAFVAEFNAASDLINEQFVVDEATGSSGPLAGDSTVRNLQSRLRSLVASQVEGLDEGFNSLVLIGISFTREARLSIDEDRLGEALSENLDKVRALFVAQGNAVGTGVEFIASTKDTQPGQHVVNVTRAPDRASLLGSTDLNVGLAEDQTLTITDGNGSASRIDLLAGDKIDAIVSKINSSLASEVAENRRATIGNTIGVDTDSKAAVNTDTTFARIFGGNVRDGDSIRIQGTTHGGVAVSRSFAIEDADTKTIGDLLTEIRNTFNSGVSASLDSEGRIVITDNQVGPSSLTVALVEGNEGGGSLNFGSIEVEEEGRHPMEISAASKDGRLSLEHASYGSRRGFRATQSLDQLGLSSAEINGADVEGTINGEAASGLGRVLTGTQDNRSAEGLALRVVATPEELATTGSELGTVQVIFGIGRLLNDQLGFITDSASGNLKNRQNAIDDTIDTLDDQIAAMERRATQVQQNLVRKFAALEAAMASLNSQGSFLSNQLASLSGGG